MGRDIYMGEEMIIGKNPVFEALKSNRMISKILLSNQINEHVEREIRQAIKKHHIVLQKVPRQRLDQLSKGKHQGVIAYVSSYEYVPVEVIFNNAKEKNELPFIIILDELEDPYNLGAILRTADAAGAHGVIIPKRRAVGLTDTVAKASAGAIEHVPVARVTNIVQVIKQLKKENIWIIGTDERATQDYREIDGTLPIAIVIGNE